MIPKFKIKAATYRHSQGKVNETIYQSSNELNYFLFCDAVSSTGPEQRELSIQVVENAIREKLENLPLEHINETNLILALQHANKKLLEFNKKEQINILVSAVIMALNPVAIDYSTKEKGCELMIAGVGDCRIYQIDQEEITLTFYDPKNSFRSMSITPQKRLLSLDNALGKKSNLYIQTRKIFKSHSQRYLAVSCGVYQQATEKSLLAIGLNSKEASVFISSCPSKDNDLAASCLILENAASASKNLSSIEPRPKVRKRSIVTLAASSAVILAIALFGINYILENNQKKQLGASSDNAEIASLMKQSKTQTELIISLKHEIEGRGNELKELRKELAGAIQQPKIDQAPSPDMEQALKTIEDLRRLLEEKEKKAIELAKQEDVSSTSDENSNLSKKSQLALQNVNNQIKMQFDSLQKAYAQKQIPKTTLEKVVADIKQSLIKKENLIASHLSSEEVNQEATALRELIISLQKSTLLKLEQTKKQISEKLDAAAKETD